MIDRYDIGTGSVGEAQFDTSQFQDVEITGTVMQFVQSGENFWENIGEGGSITSRPILTDDAVFIGAMDKNFYRLDAEGKEMWRFQTNGIIQDGCAIEKGIVYFGSADKNLYAVHADSGTLIWKFETRGNINSLPVVYKNRVFIGSNDSNFYCIHAETGKEIWRFRVRKGTIQAPLIVDDLLYFGKDDQVLHCVTLDGKEVWSFKTNGIVGAWPAAFWKGLLYIGNFDNTLYCLDAKTGKVVWTFKGTGPIMSPFIAEDSLIAGSWDQKLRCLDPKTGQVRWTFLGQGIIGAGQQGVLDGVIFTGCYDNHVYAIDVQSGKEIWRFKTNGFVSQVDTREGKVYAGSWDCNLYCIDAKTGKEIWKFRTSMGSPATISPPETHYVTKTQLEIPDEEVQEKEDRYQVETQGPGSSDYVKKSDYVQEHKYTKSRKIKSMSSGWDD